MTATMPKTTATQKNRHNKTATCSTQLNGGRIRSSTAPTRVYEISMNEVFEPLPTLRPPQRVCTSTTTLGLACYVRIEERELEVGGLS